MRSGLVVESLANTLRTIIAQDMFISSRHVHTGVVSSAQDV